jgi:hypothetical protein
MSDWKKFVRDKFPEVSEGLDWDDIDRPVALFVEIECLMTTLYINDDPADPNLLKSIYALAWECVMSEDQDLSSAAAIVFYEELALVWKLSKEDDGAHCKAMIRDVPKYVTLEQFDGFLELYPYYLHGKDEVMQFRTELYGNVPLSKVTT